MKKKVNITFKIISVLFILFLLTSFLVSVFVDINQYKPEISSFVKEAAGLDLNIHGDMRLSLLSGIKLNVDDVKLSHNKEKIIDLESISIGVSLSSLIFAEPEINSVEIKARELNISRDKNGVFNFVMEKKKNSDKSEPQNTENNGLSISQLSINNVNLSIKQFNYIDDLESVDIKISDAQASLSLLPVIDHHQLVIDDPRVLVAYSYEGQLSIKELLYNQYQLHNLSFDFRDEQGDFIAQELSFKLIQEGKKHALPPLVLDANGQLQLKLAYIIPKDNQEPIWGKPDVIKVGSFDFNLNQLSWLKGDYHLEMEQAHLVFADVAIFEGSQYRLDNLLIHSLNFDSKKIQWNKAKQEVYTLKNTQLKLLEVPIIEKGNVVNFESESVLEHFAQKGLVLFSSDSLLKQKQELKNIQMQIKGNGQKINLSPLSFQAMESELSGKGQMIFDKKNPHWSFELISERLNLYPISIMFNTLSEIKGHASFSNQLSGIVDKSDFKILQGEMHIKANDLVISGINVDKVLEDFQSSQSVGLMDVGALALLGPAGMLVTKGNDYHKLTKSLAMKGNSQVKHLNSNITYHKDIATMNDVAFATQKHRMAVKGKIDMDKEKFIDFEVATIDKDGCPIYKETIKGTLTEPTVKKANVLVSGLMNPINSLLSKVTKSMDIQCEEVFYKGVVSAPGHSLAEKIKK